MSKRRERVDRVYWGWAENYMPGCVSDNDMRIAYRLYGKQHKPNTCRKNCKVNPNCLSGFGEQSLNQTINKDAELESYMSNKIRVPGTYVGLKNLGNTCYINSLLQLWFHNIPFREAVYGWNALEDKQEMAKHLEVYNRPVELDNYEPLSSIAHLQYLFCEMQFGLKKYCDPEAFCRSLSIDVELQQDAQEFNKLYMQRLEESFQCSSNEKTRRLIQDQFRGEYSYVTTCCNCSKESERESYFYELELKVKNCNSILDSLQEFLNEEPLTGDNKYFCSNCNDKHNAFTRIRLQELPPVLQLQLLRYEIDSTIGTRRKIHSAIQFPDVLDMSPYLGVSPNTFSYKLIAVLMHGGSTAYSGHYYAHINTADGWHVFDDINVKKEKYLNLTSEENLIPVAERKTCGPKLKGFRSSSSVYMLVYRRMDKSESSDVSSSNDNAKIATTALNSDINSNFLNRKSSSPRCAEGKASPHERNGNRKKMAKNLRIGKSTKKKDVAEEIMYGIQVDIPCRENGVADSAPEVTSTENDSDTAAQSAEERDESEASLKDASAESSLLSCKSIGEGEKSSSEEKSKKDKGDFVLNCLMELKDSEKLESEKPINDMSNYMWTKLTNLDLPGDAGDVYLVFDKKILNHPRLRILNEGKVEDVNGTEYSLNGEVSSDDVECEVESSNGRNLRSRKINKVKKNAEYTDSGGGTVPDSSDRDAESRSSGPDREGEKVEDEHGSAGDGGGGDNGDEQKNTEDKIEFRSKMDETHWNMLPDYLKKAILKSRREVKSSFDSQLIEIDSRIDTQSMMKEISETIVPDSDMAEYEFINFEWLKSITKNSAPVDNSSLICKHGKLCVNKRSVYKAISRKAADFLYDKFGGGPRLKKDSLCRPCVEHKARQVKLQMDVAKDSKLLPTLTKQIIDKNQKAYWIGKRTLRKWTNYVLNDLDDDGIDDDEDLESSSTIKDGSGGEDCKKDANDTEQINDRLKNDFDEEINESFNDDIICAHDGLTVEENDRKLVSEDVWNIFLKYFPKAKAFERDHSPCVPCQNLASRDKEYRDNVRKNAVKEKELLKDLFEKKPSYDLAINKNECFLVNSDFMMKWRKYIRSIQRQTMVDAPRPEDLISALLCESHSLLLYDPEVDVERFCVAEKWCYRC
ncbi:UNVERIFIED_CONTAM: hypothetical protein PYX00_005034 [Menopon gallinae]|uniref:ubiquitinyl hydrolase 1 n=1 Tax=Menopon gallinae TaxID=328185 RepID=A0AAW2I703_9NEOP